VAKLRAAGRDAPLRWGSIRIGSRSRRTKKQLGPRARSARGGRANRVAHLEVLFWRRRRLHVVRFGRSARRIGWSMSSNPPL